VSFSPRLVVCSLELNSTTLRNLRETGVFSVNMLGLEDRAAMLDGPGRLAADVASGEFVPSESDEDVHGALELRFRRCLANRPASDAAENSFQQHDGREEDTAPEAGR